MGVAGEEREGKADKRVSEADTEGRRGSLICLSQFSTEELQGHTGYLRGNFLDSNSD